MPCRDLQDAVEQLYIWTFNPNATHFTAVLYRLIHKADPDNRRAIHRGFQHEVDAWELWMMAPESSVFFHLHGCEGRPNANNDFGQ